MHKSSPHHSLSTTCVSTYVQGEELTEQQQAEIRTGFERQQNASPEQVHAKVSRLLKQQAHDKWEKLKKFVTWLVAAYRGVPRSENDFDQLDRDGDGRIDESELMQGLEDGTTSVEPGDSPAWHSPQL